MGGLIAITDLEQLHPDRVSATRAARAGGGLDSSRATTRCLYPSGGTSRHRDAAASTAHGPNESSALAAVDRAMCVQRGPRSALQIEPRTVVLQISNLSPVTAADVARAR